MHRRRCRAALRAAGDAALKAQICARAEQFAAVEDLEARNAHYEVLWDLIVEGADNIAYRLALTTLVERQRHRVGEGRCGRARELSDVEADARAGRTRIARGEHDAAQGARDELLERSIPNG